MQRVGDEVHLDEDEARSGSTPHIVRYVLLASLVLAILAMSRDRRGARTRQLTLPNLLA